ncbi:MAG: hypothetical protein SXA11_23230 [Cyanobacteriota bacterium]|nr:hypothetical protein [Cyanobacteriota bacterium]
MGEAKRRKEYWAKQGKTPPPKTTEAKSIPSIDEIKLHIKQIESDTVKAKKDHDFKIECQQKHEEDCSKLRKSIEKQNFTKISKKVDEVFATGGMFDAETFQGWGYYQVAGLLNTHDNLDAIQAELFFRELATQHNFNSATSHKIIEEEKRLIEAEKEYLKAIECWAYMDNPLLTMFSSIPSL